MNSTNFINPKSTNKRNSSIELLKILAIILIVISHVVQTLHSPNPLIGTQNYILDLTKATSNIQHLILTLLRYSGYLGTTIFFVCSAWFLLDSNKINTQKLLQMFLDIWIVSILILILVYYFKAGNIDFKLIIMSLFPSTFANNWYMTCYLLFYPMHPFLNLIIKKMDQKTLLKTVLILSILYIFINYLHEGQFFMTKLNIWITIYFIIAYMKYYLTDISKNQTFNLSLVGIGFVGNTGILLLTNYLGLHIGAFNDKLLYWNTACSPFLILMGIGIFNISRNFNFVSPIINKISSLSLLIYIIHENILLRIYYRPLMWEWIYINKGYSHILIWTFILVIIIFVFGLISSIVYKITIHKFVIKFMNAAYPKLCKFYNKLEHSLLLLH